MGFPDDMKRSALARELCEGLPLGSVHPDVLSALALALEAEGDAVRLATELLRREGRHWGWIAYGRNEAIGSLVESCLAFRDWVAVRAGNGPEADDVKRWVDRVILIVMETYFDTAMQATYTAGMSQRRKSEERPSSATLSNVGGSRADDSADPRARDNSGFRYASLSALEGQILREVERYGRMLLHTGSDGEAQAALQSLVNKGLIMPSIGIGIGLQLTEMGRFVAHLGERA